VAVLHRLADRSPRPRSSGPYRARLAAQAADTAATRPDLKTFVEMRDKLHDALLKLELREQDVARLVIALAACSESANESGQARHGQTGPYIAGSGGFGY
jgi:hypothetical protein